MCFQNGECDDSSLLHVDGYLENGTRKKSPDYFVMANSNIWKNKYENVLDALGDAIKTVAFYKIIACCIL